jgi:hypothetical protein
MKTALTAIAAAGVLALASVSAVNDAQAQPCHPDPDAKHAQPAYAQRGRTLFPTGFRPADPAWITYESTQDKVDLPLTPAHDPNNPDDLIKVYTSKATDLCMVQNIKVNGARARKYFGISITLLKKQSGPQSGQVFAYIQWQWQNFWRQIIPGSGMILSNNGRIIQYWLGSTELGYTEDWWLWHTGREPVSGCGSGLQNVWENDNNRTNGFQIKDPNVFAANHIIMVAQSENFYPC